MRIPSVQNPTAQQIAQMLLEGFNKHYRLFRQCGKDAKGLFERGDWQGLQHINQERIHYYDVRVQETVDKLQSQFDLPALAEEDWQQIKFHYIVMLTEHQQPELAETFFNTVTSKLLHRNYYNDDYAFVRPVISTEYMDVNPPTYRSYYPKQDGLVNCIRQIIQDFGWSNPFVDIERDIHYVVRTVKAHLGGVWPEEDANLQIQILHSAFYRNKAAYIIGKAVNGSQEFPFLVPVLHNSRSELFLDTILLDPRRIGVLFSFSRSYFMVDMEVPSGYVQFLRSMMPNKPRAELYTMIGLQKHGKNLFYRDFQHHLRHSRDNLIIAPGIRGLVMLVFTLPSYPYVFKIIKDVIARPKEVDKPTVLAKYQLVKRHDRVGRMADTLEFTNVAFPRNRCTQELIDELKELAPTVIEEEGDTVIIRHLYIERRLEPLNIYLNRATPEQIDHGIREYGNAIKELATANIFPGDMLFKNFGVTRYGRVIFYDYDEIEYMTDCNFRDVPEAPSPEYEMMSEPWYPIAKNDVFPEEFSTFLLGPVALRKAFMKYHKELLTAEFWREKQKRIAAGNIEDFFPYPENMRFIHLYNEPETDSGH